jgi:inorganic triphosphatase YgiF
MAKKEHLPPVFETEQQRIRRQIDNDVLWSIITALAIVVLVSVTWGPR